jgi:outer membrane protein assembly factor BamA
MKSLASIQTAAPSPFDNVSQALQRLLADQQFDMVQARESGGALVITAQKAPFVLMTIVGLHSTRKRAVAGVGGAIAAVR